MKTKRDTDVILVLEAILDTRVLRIRDQGLVTLELGQSFDSGDESLVDNLFSALKDVSLRH